MKGTCAIAAAAASVLLTSACGGGGNDSAEGPLVNGGTFTMAIRTDPGSLEPSNVNGINVKRFLYDSLLHVGPKGEPEPFLAEKWTGTTKQATFTLREGITCSDGSALTARVVAENFNYIGDKKNASPSLGVFVMPGTTATADDAARTVEVKSGAPDAFLLRNLGSVLIACQKGLDDRKNLKSGADGTGMFTLTKAVANDRYEMTRRRDYAWGPGDVNSKQEGLPDKVVIRVLESQTTTANLLLSGEVNVGLLTGTDAKRVRAAKLSSEETPAQLGEMFFNHKDGRATTSEDVRRALVQGIDLKELTKIISGGTGVPSKGLVAADPQVCEGNPTVGKFPELNVDAANAALENAGWMQGSGGVRQKGGKPLSITVMYFSSDGTAMTAGMEYLQTAWKKLGADVKLQGVNESKLYQVLDETFDWDVSFATIGPALPSQVVPFFSGAVPPNGLNESFIVNADYTRLTEKAATQEGSAGCADWNAAEEALYDRLDVVPFANRANPVFSNGATFSLNQGLIEPSSIRMRGK